MIGERMQGTVWHRGRPLRQARLGLGCQPPPTVAGPTLGTRKPTLASNASSTVCAPNATGAGAWACRNWRHEGFGDPEYQDQAFHNLTCKWLQADEI
jgi:hypothetical protein